MPATPIEYALMAGAAYETTRGEINRIPHPNGWEPLDPDKSLEHRQNDFSGFEAAAFIKGGNDIAISFAGTYPGQWQDIAADIALGTGNLARESVSGLAIQH